jgi:phage-related protein
MPTAYVWPDVQLPLNLDETTEDPAIRSEFESGIVQTRARYTRMRQTWALGWANMRGADYRGLLAFYRQMKGGALSFNWMHPRNGATFEVRFKGSLNAKHTAMDFWNVTLTLEQV